MLKLNNSLLFYNMDTFLVVMVQVIMEKRRHCSID